MKLEKVSLKNAHISSVKGRVLRGEKMDTLYKVRKNPSTFSKFYQIFGKWIGAVPKMHPHPLEDSVLASCTAESVICSKLRMGILRWGKKSGVVVGENGS